MSEDILEKVYQENLEERIISYIAETYKVSFEDAMRIYYSSKLANKIHNGEYGVQYLDHKVLAQILFEVKYSLTGSCTAADPQRSRHHFRSGRYPGSGSLFGRAEGSC